MDQAKLSPEEVRELIDSNRHKLVRVLDVNRLLPIFRSRYILDKLDEELIKNAHRNPTSEDRTGCLLDQVEKRGTKAYQLLLDQIEEHYPDIFEELTGRMPTKKFTPARVRTMIDRCRARPLQPQIMIHILNELDQTMAAKEGLVQELSRTKTERDQEAEKYRRARSELKRLRRNENDLKKKDRDIAKLDSDLNRLNQMLTEAQDRSMRYQKEADQAKHYARLATFKNFHMECELKELENQYHLQRHQTITLRKSAHKHDQWVKQHNMQHSRDRGKVEELQKELEKIDNMRLSVNFTDNAQVCDDITGKVREQLDDAQNMNDSLNIRLQGAKEQIDQLKHDVDLLKRERKMERDIMKLNRNHLEKSHQEMEIISNQRTEINESYSKLRDQYSDCIITTSKLQATINSLRLESANLSERLLAANDQTLNRSTTAGSSSGIFSSHDSVNTAGDDVTGDEGDDEGRKSSGEEATGDDGWKGEEEEGLLPQPRQRLKRIISHQDTAASHRKSYVQKAKLLSNSFEMYVSDGTLPTDLSRGGTTSSSTPPTTGDDEEESVPRRALVGTLGFPTYSQDSSVVRLSCLSTDEFTELGQPLSMRRARSRRRSQAFSDRRRSRSQSALDEDYEDMMGYENVDFVRPGCFRYDPSTLLGVCEQEGPPGYGVVTRRNRSNMRKVSNANGSGSTYTSGSGSTNANCSLLDLDQTKAQTGNCVPGRSRNGQSQSPTHCPTEYSSTTYYDTIQIGMQSKEPACKHMAKEKLKVGPSGSFPPTSMLSPRKEEWGSKKLGVMSKFGIPILSRGSNRLGMHRKGK